MDEVRVQQWPAGVDVTVEIVARDLCIGCGVCTLACSRSYLTMLEGRGGALIPVLANGPCAVQCGGCLSVCPFWPGNANEDEIARQRFGTLTHTDGIGFHARVLAGHSASPSERLEGASGGIGSWMARAILETGFAEALVVAGTDSGGKDGYRDVRSVEEVSQCSSSRYTPLSVAEPLKRVADARERAVVYAVPCVAKGLRLLCARVPKYRRAVTAIVGLTCGHNKRPDFWRFLAERHGLDACHSRVVSYRVKRQGRASSDFGIRLEGLGADGDTRTVTLGLCDDVASFWAHKWFAMNPCLYCDDLMAECADVAIMDAWLPRFESDWRGTTIVVERHRLLDELAQGRNDAPVCESLEPEDVLLSQAAALAWKREGLAQRIAGSDIWDRDATGWKRLPEQLSSRLSSQLRWRLDARIAVLTGALEVPLSTPQRFLVSILTAGVAVADKALSVLRRLGV